MNNLTESLSLSNFHILWGSTAMMDTLGIEPRASRMLSGCDTTTPCALEERASSSHPKPEVGPPASRGASALRPEKLQNPRMRAGGSWARATQEPPCPPAGQPARCPPPLLCRTLGSTPSPIGRGVGACGRAPATRNRARDHLMAASVYSQMLCQLSYGRSASRVHPHILPHPAPPRPRVAPLRPAPVAHSRKMWVEGALNDK